MFIQLNHVETICRNVVGSTTEGDEEEEAHRCLKPEGGRQREGDAGKGSSDESLHGEHPPALSLQQIYERTPQGLDDPGKGEPSGIETHLSIGQPQLHVHHHREGGYDDVGESLGKIEGRNPCPWTPTVFLCYHFTSLFIKFLDFSTLIVVQQDGIIMITLLAHHGSTNLAEAYSMPPTGSDEFETLRHSLFIHIILIHHKG